MTKQMALEFAPLGIRVLGVAPTFVPTKGNMRGPGSDGPAPTRRRPSSMNHSLIGRLGTPDDIARVVLFCASDMSIKVGDNFVARNGNSSVTSTRVKNFSESC